MKAKLIDLLTEGHELYFPPLVEAMEANADFAAVIERAIGAERVATDLLAAGVRAERALVKMHAQRIWNERHSWDSARAEDFADKNPLPEVYQLRAAITAAKGTTP